MADLTKLPPTPPACLPAGVTDQHGKDAFEVRFGTATAEATKTGTVPHTTNGDESLADKSATFTKCLDQSGYGIVNPAAFALFKAALTSGKPTDFEKPGLLGRASLAYPSPVDWAEARLCGQAAVDAAEDGKSGVMVTLVREQGHRGLGPAYSATTSCAPLEKVAFTEKKFPADWRTSAGADVSPAFADYAAPLVGAIAPHEHLAHLPVNERRAR